MKRPTNFTVTNFILQRALFFLALASVWYIRYDELKPFVSAPRFQLSDIPEGWLHTATAHFLPLFADAFWGAWVLAFLALVALLACDVILWQVFKYRRMQCLAFITPMAVTLHFIHEPLPNYIFLAAVLSAIAFVLFLLTYRKRYIKISFQSRPLLTVTNLLPYVLIGVTVVGILAEL